MQLERGKSSTGLLGSFRSIIREEGYVSVSSPVMANYNEAFFVFIEQVVFIAVVDDLLTPWLV